MLFIAEAGFGPRHPEFSRVAVLQAARDGG